MTEFQSRRPALLVATGVLVTLAGCQYLPWGSKPASAPEVRRETISTPVTETAPLSAIETALAAEAQAKAGDVQTANLQNVAVNATAPRQYQVKRGDTLWGIASSFLRDPWLWPEIWHVNPAVRNPHLIYPGDQLTLAYGSNGEPQLRLIRGDALRVSPLVRSNAIDGPIAAIPYEAISAFMGRPTILSREDLRRAPQVAAIRDRHMLAGVGQEVYVRGLQNRAAGRYTVVRPSDELRDPETGDVLGNIGVFTAAARVETPAKITKAVLTESARETQAGDLLFVDEVQVASGDLMPHAPPAGTTGQIMAVVDGVQLIGQYQVIAINRGTRHGLEPGHVLAIDQRGEVTPDTQCKRRRFAWCVGKEIQLPVERAGSLLVFKTYDRMSYGLVVNTTVPVRVADHVRAP